MTRVDFYILEDQGIDASMRFACRLSCKAYLSGHPVHIHVNDNETAKAMDELLWDYPKHRFIPHVINSETPEAVSTPIQIGHTAPQLDHGVLINLADAVPEFFGRFDRVAEVIVEQTKTQGRAHYKHYRDRGYPLHHHELSDWEQSA